MNVVILLVELLFVRLVAHEMFEYQQAGTSPPQVEVVG